MNFGGVHCRMSRRRCDWHTRQTELPARTAVVDWLQVDANLFGDLTNGLERQLRIVAKAFFCERLARHAWVIRHCVGVARQTREPVATWDASTKPWVMGCVITQGVG